MKRDLFPHHNRIKPKTSQKNVSKKIVDKGFLTWLHEVKKPACFICGREYYYNSEADKTDLHHIKGASMDVKNDQQVIPLCSKTCHKDGNKLSAHGTPKRFRELHPLDEQIMASLEFHIEYLKTRDESISLYVKGDES